MPGLAASVVEDADDPGGAFVARDGQAELLHEVGVGRGAGHRRRPRVGHVGQERAEGDHELDPELLRQIDDLGGERAPPEVRLDAEKE